MSARRQYIAYGVAILLVVGSCFGARFLVGRDHRDADAAKISTAPSTTAAQYSDLLAEADSAIGTDFRRLDTTSAQILAGAVPIAAQTMYAQVQKLRTVKAPPVATGPHADLLTQLTGLSDMIQSLGTDRATPSCPAAETSPYGSLLTSSFADGIRADAAALVKANPAFVFGKFLPAAPELPASRPATGALIRSASRHGSGELKIKNGGPDTAVSLVPTSGTRTPLFTVYVRGGSDYAVNDVGTGTYTIYYEAGRDWNPARKGFMNDCTFSKFDDTFPFRAYPVISTWEITMTPVAGGNASTSDVDPDTFPNG
jgi:hypothetical protein